MLLNTVYTKDYRVQIFVYPLKHENYTLENLTQQIIRATKIVTHV